MEIKNILLLKCQESYIRNVISKSLNSENVYEDVRIEDIKYNWEATFLLWFPYILFYEREIFSWKGSSN